ncbi:hypothetical protein [Lentilitoribacter sp. Alg239-R112]|uniref:hypothetical protein n=1 Tax=Lentilitoribacter sp. Alg239-R112 TaxID=2305987 RepID=UPI0013A6E2DF|nr:hypothetical protein [Lentilitoribacter sp. Alg239-R112]
MLLDVLKSQGETISFVIQRKQKSSIIAQLESRLSEQEERHIQILAKLVFKSAKPTQTQISELLKMRAAHDSWDDALKIYFD